MKSPQASEISWIFMKTLMTSEGSDASGIFVILKKSLNSPELAEVFFNILKSLKFPEVGKVHWSQRIIWNQWNLLKFFEISEQKVSMIHACATYILFKQHQYSGHLYSGYFRVFSCLRWFHLISEHLIDFKLFHWLKETSDISENS